MLEAGIVGLLLVLVLNVLPLNRIIHLSDSTDNQNVIAEVDRKKKTDAGEQPEANKQNPSFVDEEVKQGPTIVATNIPPAVVEVKSKVEPPIAIPKPLVTTATAAPTVEKVTQPKSAGWIYRGQFLVTNAAAISPKIKDRILELGGQKAGEVEIGWQKSPNLYYFHFTVPEAKLAELETVLKEFSTGKMIKENHPRVMPDGIVRLLFTVEEKAAVNK